MIINLIEGNFEINLDKYCYNSFFRITITMSNFINPNYLVLIEDF